MADSKRNSVAGKVATPKTAGGAATPPVTRMMDQTEALAKSIGARSVGKRFCVACDELDT